MRYKGSLTIEQFDAELYQKEPYWDTIIYNNLLFVKRTGKKAFVIIFEKEKR